MNKGVCVIDCVDVLLGGVGVSVFVGVFVFISRLGINVDVASGTWVGSGIAGRLSYANENKNPETINPIKLKKNEVSVFAR